MWARKSLRVTVRRLHALERDICFGFFDHASLLHDVLQAIRHPRIGGQAIASCASCLLVIAFDTAWQIEVRHKSDIRFIDAHTEGNRCHHDDAVFTQKSRLMLAASGRIHAGMVGQRADAVLAQKFSGLFNFLA